MYCFGHFRVSLLIAATLLSGWALTFTSFAQTSPVNTQSTEVDLHWGARPGVVRYRLQLATDNSFADILFDRVVSGNDYKVEGLDPGRYFWRVAPLTKQLGQFSSAGVIEVRRVATRPTPTPFSSRENSNRTPAANQVVARGGWRAAVGDIAQPVLAHLRSKQSLDVAGMNEEGAIFALDASSGVAIWSTGRRLAKEGVSAHGSVIPVQSRSGLDYLVAFSGASVAAIEGATGHELWKTTLPAAAANATVLSDNRSQSILFVDNSLSTLR